MKKARKLLLDCFWVKFICGIEGQEKSLRGPSALAEVWELLIDQYDNLFVLFLFFFEVFLNIFQKRLMFISISLFFVSYSKIKSYPGVWFKPYYSSRKTSSNLWKKDIGHHWFLFIPNSDSTKLAMRRFYFDIFQGILIFSKCPEFLFQ